MPWWFLATVLLDFLQLTYFCSDFNSLFLIGILSGLSCCGENVPTIFLSYAITFSSLND